MNVINPEINATSLELLETIKDLTGCKPKGGAALMARLGKFASQGAIRIFVPWATPSRGRTDVGQDELETLGWLFDAGGLVDKLGKFAPVSTKIMIADSYAQRNGFNMGLAQTYWNNVTRQIDNDGVEITYASNMDDQPMQRFKAEQSYAFERLSPKQRDKILAAAAKYSGLTGSDLVYEAAAEYSMLRAAEARYVDTELDALWVSLNWPERDIMCGDTPRIYIPEDIRAPWLKES